MKIPLNDSEEPELEEERAMGRILLGKQGRIGKIFVEEATE
jgi:hypothetical protein